ncbi:MAG TPA: hypothetical protein VJ202_01230 [Thermodesulfobacteriota bacterium]|nr:hypothetical protein [Thermodesulfobacteriota bacterium]
MCGRTTTSILTGGLSNVAEHLFGDDPGDVVGNLAGDLAGDTPPALTPPVITPPTTTTPAVQAAAEAERAAYKKRRGRRSTILTAGSSRDYTEGYGLGSGLSGKKKVLGA